MNVNSIMKLIDSSDLVRWASVSSKDCEQNFPLLLRYLIRESVHGIHNMRFPAGDSTRYSGWDGILETREGFTNIPEFIPIGTSYWEIGTGEDYLKKANKDYSTRTKNDKGYDIKNSTFVFATPRIWEDDSRKTAKNKKGKNDWIKKTKSDSKNTEYEWNDIIVYDARDLEEWLQKCPNAALWLATHLGKLPSSGIEALVDFWKRWTINPKHTLTPELVLSRRNSNSLKLIEWLKKECKTYTLKSLTKEEAVAFLYASISTLSDEDKNYFLERCIIVKDFDTFLKFSKIYGNHILINYFDDTSAADYATINNNHVFIPITPDNSTAIVDSELNTLGVYELIHELQKIGFDSDEANQLSKDSGKSLSVLRRILQFKQQQPEWTKKENSNYLLTALLLGKWDENNVDDKSIVSFLSQSSYDNFINNLNTFNTCEDPPIFNIGNMWGVRSQYDAWFILAPNLNQEILQKYFETLNKVLFEIDPEFYLDEDERYKAQVLGVKRKYSGWMRDGLLNSLILFSIYGDRTQNKSIHSEVQKFVNNLLDNADDKRWFSISNILPQLAEADPEALLDNLEKELDQDTPSILVLFREGKDSFTSRCNYAGLLWALESLAWNPEYLSAVTLVLARLIPLQNKKGKWGNNPEGSLRNIYLPWFPNTSANLETRLIALDRLIEEDEKIAFNILLKLMPIQSDIAHPTYKPHWRGFTEYKVDKSNDRFKTESEYFAKILKIAKYDGVLLSRLVPFFDSLHNISDRVILYDYIKNNISKITSGLTTLRESLRRLIMRHKSFAEANWVLPKAIIDQLDELFQLIPSENVESDYKWLFDEYFPNIDASKKNQTEYEPRLNELRINAIKKLYENIELQGLISFSHEVKESYFLGQALCKAELLTFAQEETIIKSLDEDKYKLNFARGYILCKIYNSGKTWIDKVINILKTKNFENILIINFLILLNFERDTWSIVATFNEKIKQGYWQKWTGRVYKLSEEDSNYSYGKLIEHKRYITATDSITLWPETVSNEIIVRVLKGMRTEKTEEPERESMDSYRIGELFKILDKRNYNDEKVLIHLEYLYADILSDDILDRPPRLLHKAMGENPSFYIDVIKTVFKPEDDINLEQEEIKGLSESMIQKRADIGWQLLRSFHTIPGSDGKGKINYEKLKKWVDDVVKLSIEYKREAIVKDKIGELLAFSEEENNVWPQEEVCQIIEYLKNKYVDEAFYVSERNKRGTVTKSMFEGGEQEQDMESIYINYAKKLNPKYKRTIKILKMIAQSYNYEALKEDERAEQDKMKN